MTLEWTTDPDPTADQVQRFTNDSVSALVTEALEHGVLIGLSDQMFGPGNIDREIKITIRHKSAVTE